MDTVYDEYIKKNFETIFAGLNNHFYRILNCESTIRNLRNEIEKCHREYAELRKQSLTTIESVNEYLSVYQLCHYIPSHPMASTIRTWCCQDKIPHHKMNGKLVFLKNEIDEWLKSKL